MGFESYIREEIVSPVQVQTVESGRSVRLGRVAVSPSDLPRVGRDGARTAPEDTAAKIREAAIRISQRELGTIGCFRSPEFGVAGWTDSAST